MPFVQTHVWLKRLYKDTDENGVTEIPKFQRLMKHFQDWSKEEWMMFLYQQGLLPITSSTEKDWRGWLEKGPTRGLREFYDNLQKTFQGPDVDIFIFPINTENKELMDVMKGKNGLTYPDFTLLLFSKDISIKGKQALLLHEYHHVCRLHHQKHTEHSVTLLESMVMEGLAEWEVRRRVGESYVTSWMTLYDDKTLIDYWKRILSTRKNLKGRRNQLPFLYGGRHGLPKWLGYCIGYRMVESYMENVGNKTSVKLLTTSPEEIHMESVFNE